MKFRYVPAAAVSLAAAVFLEILFLIVCPRFKAPLSFALYDREGKLLGASVADDHQWRLPARQVPEKFKTALIVFEDRRFYLHAGLDPLALARALRQNSDGGRIVSGGSTLTMQTVRLSHPDARRNIAQKAKEALLAIVLELRYTKGQILSLYAANAPFGGNVVGLEAASWRYYNRSPEDMTWAEAATLAVLPNQPSLVHPGADRKRLLERRNRLLLRLAALGRLDDDQLRLSLEEPLPAAPYPLPRLAPHYLERLKKTGSGISTIDRKTQASVVSILERWSSQFDSSGIHNAAALVIDTGTGDILAYAGNTGADRSTRYNGDVDIIVSRRSSGSLLKPFLYAGMLDAGLLLPDQLVVDIPTRIGSYKPENNVSVYQGAVPAGEALSRSLNVPAIRELQEFGIAPFLELLAKSGFTTLDRTADEYGLPLILGGGEITLDETVLAYAGLMNRASLADSGQGGRKTLLSPVSAGAAWLTLEALVYGARPNDESLWQSYASAQKIAWKTGTSYGNRDAWAIGVTPRFAVGVWVGNATGEGRPELKSITTAAPVLFDIFGSLGKSDWPAPCETEMRVVKVCASSGYAAGPHCEETAQSRKPKDAPDGLPCPWCRTVSLTPDGKYQATAGDLTGRWKGSLPLIRKQFVLPPVMEYWYRRHALSYKTLPPWIDGHSGDSAKADLSIVFPESGARVFIPVEIDGESGALILEVAHRDGRQTIYWDIDGEYLGETRNYHRIQARPSPGTHVLTVTDSSGQRATRRFEVLRE